MFNLLSRKVSPQRFKESLINRIAKLPHRGAVRRVVGRRPLDERRILCGDRIKTQVPDVVANLALGHGSRPIVETVLDNVIEFAQSNESLVKHAIDNALRADLVSRKLPDHIDLLDDALSPR